MKCHFGTSILRLYLLLRCIHTLQQPLLYLAAPLIHRLHLHPLPVLLLPAALVVGQPDFLFSFHNLQIFAKFVSLFTLQ